MRRVLVLWGLLSVLSLMDYALTVEALASVPGARELNPVGAALLTGGGALAWKLAGLVVAGACAVVLARGGREAWAARGLAAWCCVFAAVNAFSVAQLSA